MALKWEKGQMNEKRVVELITSHYIYSICIQSSRGPAHTQHADN